MANVTFQTDPQTLRNLAVREQQKRDQDAAKRLRRNSKRRKTQPAPGTGPLVVKP
jgi:hypothetical protein